MIEIALTFIANQPKSIRSISQLIHTFEKLHAVRVRWNTFPWDEAWATTCAFAAGEITPDLLHIGSTWTLFLAEAGVARSFSPADVAKIGGEDAFIAPAWQSTRMAGEDVVWALPWSINTYVLAFRRDVLERAGLDPADAFASPTALHATLAHLQSKGETIPLVIPIAPLELIHVLISWVWGAGGAFLSADGQRVRLGEPATFAGFHDFFSLYRYFPPEAEYMDSQQHLALFQRGEAAVAILSADVIARDLMQGTATVPRVRETLEVAPLPAPSWVGGNNLVVRRSTDPHREALAVELATQLVSREAQVQLCQQLGVFPARYDAYEALNLAPASLRTTLTYIYRTGQPHPSTPLWAQFEEACHTMLHRIVAEVTTTRAHDVDAILRKHLTPLARHLEKKMKSQD